MLRRLKRRAAAEGTSLQDLANQVLRRGLATPARAPYTLAMKGWKATAQPGVDLLDRDTLFDVRNWR